MLVNITDGYNVGMRVRPEHLISFVHVAQAGSVSVAAEQLHRTQPALSAQLRRLTDAVGEPLYSRHYAGVRLTPTGEALLPFALEVTRAMEAAQRWADDLGELTIGRLRLAASMTVAVYLLPELLARFHARHPGLELELLTRNSVEALALLKAGRADLCIVEGPIGSLPEGVTAELVGQDEIVLVVRPDHPLGSAAALQLGELDGLEVVRREVGSGTREVVDRALASAGVRVRTSLEATGLEAVKEAVLHGFGAGFLARVSVQRELDGGLLKVVPIPDVSLVRSLTLLRLPEERSGRAARALLAFLREHLR